MELGSWRSQNNAHRMIRVLVVDDDQELANLLAFGLQRRGHVVELAANGSEALERVRRARFDVVLVDWNMPVMDGPSFLQQYRREAGTSLPPIVAMSGDPQSAAQAVRLGAAAVVLKPFRLEALETLLVNLADASEHQGGFER